MIYYKQKTKWDKHFLTLENLLDVRRKNQRDSSPLKNHYINGYEYDCILHVQHPEQNRDFS